MRLTEILVTELADVGDPGPRSNRPAWLSIVAYAAAEDGGGRLVGGGVSTLPPGRQSPWNFPAVADGLARLPAPSGQDLPSTGDVVEWARRLARRHVHPAWSCATTRIQRTALRSVRGAVETALLDLAARCRGEPMAQLLGVRREVPRPSTVGVSAAGGTETVRRGVADQCGDDEVIRLLSAWDVDVDVAALLAAAEVDSAAGQRRPLWLDGAGGYGTKAAERLVTEVAELVARGRLSCPVYVGQPVPSGKKEELARLTVRAAELVPGGSLSGELRIVLNDSVGNVDELAFFLEHGHVSALSVDVRRGMSDALRVVERAVEANPDVMVVASGVNDVTDIEWATLAALAQSMPKLDVYLPGSVRVRLAAVSADGETDGGMAGGTAGDETGRVDAGMDGGDAAVDSGRDTAVTSAGTASPSWRGGLATAPSLERIVTWMGRGVWRHADRDATPLLSTGPVAPYDSRGLDRFGKNTLDSHLLGREALRLGLTTVRFAGVDLHAEDATGRGIGFHCTTGPTTSRYVGKVCDEKPVARSLLARAGVPVPTGRVFGVTERAGICAFAADVGWPVVVKPTAGKGGAGVTADITRQGELDDAVRGLAAAGHADVLVEAHVPGHDYRLLVVGDEVVSAVQREPAEIVGDGRATVAELVLAKNLARQWNPHLRTRLARFDAEAIALLRRRGMSPASVPPEGERVALTLTGNLSRGGDSVEVLDETHSSLLELAVRAVRAVPGLDHAGVDVLAEDHRRPVGEQSAVVCEINKVPGSTSHHFPARGPARNVSRSLVEYYARRYDLATAPQPDPLSVHLRITGLVQGVGYRAWTRRSATDLGLSGWVLNGDDGAVHIEATGPFDLVSALSVQAIFGPPGSRVQLVETTPMSDVHAGEFRILR